jgi:AraC family transcriptional regulator
MLAPGNFRRQTFSERTMHTGLTEEFRGEILQTRRLANFSVVAISYAPNQVLPPHRHEHAHLSISIRGAYLEQCPMSTWECTTGGTIFHAPGESHGNRFLETGAHLLALELHPEFLSRIAEQGIATDRQFRLTSVYCMRLAVRLEGMLKLSDPLSAMSAEGLCLELLSEALQPGSGRLEEGSCDWLLRVHEILHDRYREHLSLADLAGQVQVHPVHLARAFRKRYRCRIGDFIRKLRVEAACRELLQSNAPIAEIAARTGFTDQSHLTRIMKRNAGVSPAEFRRSRGRT